MNHPKKDNEIAPLRIAFIHPNLGIGGAERLVVDAALGLQNKGHQIVIYTSHHDQDHCFQETKDGTLTVKVLGDSLPDRIFGRFFIVCAIARQFVLTLWLLWFRRNAYDIWIVDQLSACVPLLSWLTPARVLFYCHFPDQLLSPRGGLLRRLYRAVFDFLEAWSVSFADSVVVNSKFTASVYQDTFGQTPDEVLYPPINFTAYDQPVHPDDTLVRILASSKHTFLSINRFERKKNVALAVHAMAKFLDTHEKDRSNYRLVVAGGYDLRVTENADHLTELDTLATRLGLITFTLLPGSRTTPPPEANVIFLCSFSDAERTYLLSHSAMLLYTPSNEHFGIAPVEAMYAKLPVIATNSGGPLETVENELTGLLLPPEPDVWAQGMQKLLSAPKEMGERGRIRVKTMFSLDIFAERLNSIILRLNDDRNPKPNTPGFASKAILFVIVLCALTNLWHYIK